MCPGIKQSFLIPDYKDGVLNLPPLTTLFK